MMMTLGVARHDETEGPPYMDAFSDMGDSPGRGNGGKRFSEKPIWRFPESWGYPPAIAGWFFLGTFPATNLDDDWG